MNIDGEEVERISRSISEEKIEIEYASSDLLDFDVFLISVKNDEKFITDVANDFNLERDSVESAASGENLVAFERFYVNRKKHFRIMLFAEQSFVESSPDCRTEGLIYLLLVESLTDLVGDAVVRLFNCETADAGAS